MKSTSGTRKPYNGLTKSLVLALDIGTTFSGVSYAILEPGEVPKIHGVTRFPGQEHVAGNSKIPSIMYYDKTGKMMAAGAEAESASILAEAEDEGWIKAELFKLRLRPKAMKLRMNGMRLAALPRGKTAVDVFADFLAYLFRCTRSFIVDTHANGPTLWHSVEHDIQFVLSHPNGWEGAQQTKMRRAAVYGGLIPDTDEGKSRIRFVTEGEASLHACVLNGLAADVLQNTSGHGFIVADAGGGTLDISSYAIRGTAPLVIEEIAPPDCVFAGSVFVSRRARAFFEEKLKASKYGTSDSLDHITKRFDETTKRLFRDNKELQFVPFGSPLDKDLTAGIRGGQLKLTGAEVAALFEPSIQAAVASIKSQIDASGGAVKSVWLVGGFAASPWLFSQLQERLAAFEVTVSRPDSQTSKAVADGAIGFYCDHHVSARMSKFMYGVEYLREFDAKDEEHVARKHRLFELPSGPRLLPDAFDCILSRGVKVKESTLFSRKYCTEVTNLSTLSVFEVEIWCYRGGDTIPKWILRGAENFSTLCYVRADLSPLAGSAQSKASKNGKMYWTVVFSIEIHFGLTEFKARIKWTDNGKTKYGPASIVYNEGGHRADEEEPDDSPDDNVTVLSSQSDKYPSHHTSRAPSRDPVSVAGSRNTHSVQASPRLPSAESVRPDMSRSSSMRSTARSELRSSFDKGKQREMIPEIVRPESIRETDRSINVSGRSADSGRSGSTRLGETLSSVWGSISKPQTPLASPLVGSVRSGLGTPREETTVATPREASKVATPREASKVATPREVSGAQTAKDISHVATPKDVSRVATPKEVSHTPTPKEVSRVATPKEVSKAPTPAAVSKAPSPKEVSKAPTPKELSKAPTPAEVSKAPTPKETSKAPTPKETSKAPTPKETSKAPTPKATSKAPTPKSTSKVPTPKADPPSLPDAAPATPAADTSAGAWTQYPSPYEDVFVPPPPPSWEMQPPAAEVAPSVTALAELAPATPAVESAPAHAPLSPTPAQTGGWGTSAWSSGAALGSSGGRLGSGANNWGSSDDVDWFKDENDKAPATPDDLKDLLSSPGPEPASKESAGLLSGFLSKGTGWGSATRASSTFGGGKPSFGTGGGFMDSLGSSLFPGGSSASASNSAKGEKAKKKAEEDAKKKAEEDSNRKAEEEARKQAEEEARKAEEAAAAVAAQKAEEETRRKAEEEAAVQKAKEEADAAARKAQAEEEARIAEEAAAVAKQAEEEEAAARKAEEDTEAAKKADEEAAAVRQAEEDAAAAKQAEEDAAAKMAADVETAQVTEETQRATDEVETNGGDEEKATAETKDEVAATGDFTGNGDGAAGQSGADDLAELLGETKGEDEPATPPNGGEDGENVDGEGDGQQEGEEEQREEEDSGGKKNKKKKKGKNVKDEVETPEAISRTTSTATGGGGKKKGKKGKKG